MSGKRRDLTEDERRLWGRVASSVKPRRKHPGAAVAPPTPAEPVVATRPAKSVAPRAAATAKAKPDAPLAERGGERKVRRGQLDIDASIDLHGHTQERALAALERFLSREHGRGARTLLVVTGMGRGGEGVLKRRFPDWLALPRLRALVSGYAQAHRSHGGAGAFYVFVRRRRA